MAAVDEKVKQIIVEQLQVDEAEVTPGASFQMGFHTLAIQKKGDEVWRVLSSAKKEFETYGGLMQKVEDQVGTVQNTIQKLGVRTRAINKALKNVSSIDTGAPISNLIGFDDISGTSPLLAASAEED